MRARNLTLLFALAPFACGGAPPPPPQNPVVAPLATAVTIAPPAFDTSAVAAPPNVALVVRFTNVSASADKLSRWTRLPLSPLELLGDDRAAQAVDLSQPLDIVVAIEDHHGRPNPVVLTSAAIRSLDDAKSIMGEKNDLVSAENGIIKVMPKHRPSKPASGNEDDKDDSDYSDDARRCALAPAFGSSPYRLVCADTESALGKLLAYVTRGVTRLPLDQDVHAEAYAAPVRKYVSSARRELMQELSRNLSGAPALMDLLNAYDPFELALDADHATFDAKLDDSAGDASLSLVFREKQSAWTKAFTSHPELAGAAPAGFLRLPVDADIALYTHGFDATELDKARQFGGDALAQQLQSDGLGANDAQALGNALKNTIASLSGPIVYARGVDVVQARAALNLYKNAKDAATKQKTAKAAIEQVAGWEVFGLEQPIAKVGPNLKEYGAAFGRPTFAKWSKANTGDVPPTFKASTTIAGLPADSLHFEIVFTHVDATPVGKGKPAAQPVITKLHIIAVPDQGHTWLVDAMDEATATAKAKGLLSGLADGTLAKRPGIEALKTKSGNTGGFFSMQGVGLDLPIAWAARTPINELQGDDVLGGMSTQQEGATIVPFVFVEQAPTAGMAGAVTLSLHVPKEAITDVMTYGNNLF